MANFFQSQHLPTPTPQKQPILLLFTTYSLLTAQPSFDILPYPEPLNSNIFNHSNTSFVPLFVWQRHKHTGIYMYKTLKSWRLPKIICHPLSWDAFTIFPLLCPFMTAQGPYPKQGPICEVRNLPMLHTVGLSHKGTGTSPDSL